MKFIKSLLKKFSQRAFVKARRRVSRASCTELYGGHNFELRSDGLYCCSKCEWAADLAEVTQWVSKGWTMLAPPCQGEPKHGFYYVKD